MTFDNANWIKPLIVWHGACYFLVGLVRAKKIIVGEKHENESRGAA